MSGGWSVYVIALVVLQLVGCVVLLWRTSRRHAGDAEPEKTGHVWDGDLTEYNKPLPRWWINLFYLTILFTIGYLVWYPGLGNFAGSSGWTSRNEHAADKAAGDAKLAATFAPYDGKPLPDLAADPKALALGHNVFVSTCAVCHGSGGQGAVGYPNLSDSIWQWGGEPEQILETVLNGRQAAMPAWADTLTAMGGASAKDDVISYVLSLSGKEKPAAEVLERGQKLFTGICAACHGPDGKGNPVLGAPNLTDQDWVYGSDRATLMTGIEKGRNGQMPAHKPLIGETRARLAAAYVWSLSHKPGTTP
jgi:cytochrome c oxidase cbb3-type subunit III